MYEPKQCKSALLAMKGNIAIFMYKYRLLRAAACITKGPHVQISGHQSLTNSV